MGSRRGIQLGGRGTKDRPPADVPAPRRRPTAAAPDSADGNGSAPSRRRRQAEVDARIQELVDAAPPLTEQQRDTLALLLRRPRRGTGRADGARAPRRVP